ncbi:MAG TPA: SDR family oxidoreductase [Blastocatellia bacterium]|nr:SDR family oxidoreductase [Blastocatellia bacterium]
MPRSINEQVVVITGASSGIGRTTARMFAAAGARLVLGSRNAESLNEIVHEIAEAGGVAHAIPTDVTEREHVEQLADAALNYFGRIDTWVNNAGISIIATFDKLTDEEIRRIMDVNFMGAVYGIQAALPRMRAQAEGTIINVASIAGKRAIPLQSIYSASKFAIVGLGESLRAELASEPAQINICTICPPSINTPFFDHALTKEGFAPKPMAPVYEPEAVAEAIISCAENPQREVLIGSAGKMLTLFNTVAPGLADWFMGKAGVSGQLTDEPKSSSEVNNLFEIPPDKRERGGWTAQGTREGAEETPSSNIVTQHPIAASLAGAAALAIAARLLFR